jgi:hypothetical protein
VNPFLLLSISQRDYEIKLGLRISAVGESLQFYFSAKQEHSSRLKQRADFLRILLKNRLGGKRGEIGPNSELVGVINRRWLNELFPRTSGTHRDLASRFSPPAAKIYGRCSSCDGQVLPQTKNSWFGAPC